MWSHQGYLANTSEGLCIASFVSPASALCWALAIKDALMHADWPEALLEHELCEEVKVPSALHDGPSVPGSRRGSASESYGEPPRSDRGSLLLRRGPRIKAGIECCGEVKASVQPATGRMDYRGRVMNRAARIADKAHSNDVVCSAAAWTMACTDMEAAGAFGLLHSRQLGSWQCKGVGWIEVVEVSLAQPVRAQSTGAGSLSNTGNSDVLKAGRLSKPGMRSKGMQARPSMRDSASQTD
uniref:Guanylate cyclase domain-containing protein n=1 Tax=Chlamydomonas leiostraca TaxID=1034604 RepID=A0A7S0REA4_9CHLO